MTGSSIEDPERLDVLHRTHLLDSGREALFDQISRVAATRLNSPSAFVTLIDRDRQYHKSQTNIGPDAEDAPSEVALNFSFCKHVVETGEPLLVDDSRTHPLVKDNDAVQKGVIAYAGVPLRYSGHILGALCVIDSTPRHWSQEDVETLTALAQSVVGLIDDRAPDVLATAGQSKEGDSDQLIEAVSRHLRALDAYRSTINGLPSVDFGAEANARDAVQSSIRFVAERFSALEPNERTQRLLVLPLRRYLAARQSRRKEAEQFSGGHGILLSLQAAIEEELEAEDVVRAAVRKLEA